jgi:hypothetical protein
MVPKKNISLARSRGRKKNGNCFVEQKNYASVVRKIVGYVRFSGEKGVAALQAVYAVHGSLLNYFYPCQKLVSKERAGSRAKKGLRQTSNPRSRSGGCSGRRASPGAQGLSGCPKSGR